MSPVTRARKRASKSHMYQVEPDADPVFAADNDSPASVRNQIAHSQLRTRVEQWLNEKPIRWGKELTQTRIYRGLFCLTVAVVLVLLLGRPLNHLYRNSRDITQIVKCTYLAKPRTTTTISDCISKQLQRYGRVQLYPGALYEDLSWALHPDHRAVLGVSPDAERKEVQNAYQKLAKRWHPDKAQTGLSREENTLVMSWINEAYDNVARKRGSRRPALCLCNKKWADADCCWRLERESAWRKWLRREWDFFVQVYILKVQDYEDEVGDN